MTPYLDDGDVQLHRAGARIIIERAIKDSARRGCNGYDELARAVISALDRNRIILVVKKGGDADHATVAE